MLRLIRVFAGRTGDFVTLRLKGTLSLRPSNIDWVNNFVCSLSHYVQWNSMIFLM